MVLQVAFKVEWRLPLAIRRYRMVSSKDDSKAADSAGALEIITETDTTKSSLGRLYRLIDRRTYHGSLFFNLLAFLLPALYGTLSKLWVANIDSSLVVTTDVYTYISVIVNVLNDGLPRTSWLILGDKSTRTTRSRLTLAYTLISVQAFFGLLLTMIFIASASKLAAAFVPVNVRVASLTYVRISSVQALSSSIEVAVGSAMRALDHPDVPLLISSLKFVINIVLDLLVISRFHVGPWSPTVNTQALVRMACDLTAAMVGLLYFVYVAAKMQHADRGSGPKPSWSFEALKTLLRPGVYTFVESALRNAFYLWLVSGIVSMGSDYATAWGVFNTIRWGIVMVPVQALEASTLTFVGHAWGRWRAQVGPEVEKPKATRREMLKITRPAFVSCIIALIVEVPFCLFLSFWGIRNFAFYLSESEAVADITQKMWKSIDWCYIFYALNYQLAAILLATVPRWFLYQALGSNLAWMMPWAIAVSRIGMTPNNAWTYHSVIFGGALVFDFCNVTIVCVLWAWMLARGRIWLAPVYSS